MLHKTSESMDVQTQGGATNFENIYRKITSSNTSHLEANVGRDFPFPFLPISSFELVIV